MAVGGKEMTEPWPMVLLGEVLKERQELPPDDALIKGEIRIVEKIGFKEGRIQLRNDNQTKTGMILIKPGDLVVSGINAAKGAIAIYGEDNNSPIAATIHYGAYIPDKSKVEVKFLWRLLRSGTFRDLLNEYVPGGIKTELKAKRLLPIPVPLPDLEEQRRILMRIEELAARIEEARELRRRAVEETEALLFAYATEVFGDNNGFTKIPVESFCNVRGGIQKSSERVPGANPRRYITVAHVQRNRIDTSDIRYFEVSDEELERWRLLPGDVLVIEGNGSADQIGRTALFKGEIEDCVHQNHVIRIRPDQKRVLPEYLNAYLNSPPGQSQMRERSRTTSGLFNLSVGRIKSIEVLLPSLEVQRRIVTSLDGFQAKIDALKRHHAETAAELDALMPSILDRAFRGEL